MTGAIVADLLALTGPWRDALIAGAIVFLRIGAAMALLPAFGEMVVPMRVRLALALALTLVVTPIVQPDLQVLVTASDGLWRALATEVAAGLLFGIGLRLVLHALQVAGTIAAQSTSLAQFFGGVGTDPQPAMAQILVMAGFALAMAAGLHVHLIEALVGSYRMFPPGQLPSGSDVAAWGVDRVSQMFALAFSLSAPFVIAALIYNLGLGIINRAMPQLMVAFVGAPLLTLGGLVLLFLASPLLLSVWLGALQSRLGEFGS